MAAAGIVLTGGRSTRMGSDKASLLVDGRRLVDHVIDILRRCGVSQIVVAGPNLGGFARDVQVRPDATDEALGPMAGIVSGWHHLRSATGPRPDPVVVVACDLPTLSTLVIGDLISRSDATRHGAIASDGEELQPLLAAYRAAALDDMVDAFAQGERSVRRCLGGWNLAVVVFEPGQVADADAPSDLAQFTVAWPEERGDGASR